MGILSLKPSSFIINLGITLVLSGLIMVYVKQKFASYDKQFNSIDNHLKNLVSMVQKQSASFASSVSSRVNWCSQPDSKINSLNTDSSSLAAEGALDAAKEAHDRFGGKIVVSDNESDDSSESESEDSSESESEDSTESESESKSQKLQEDRHMEEIQLDHLKVNGEIKQIFITGEEPMHFLNNLMVLGNQKMIGKTLDLDNIRDNETDGGDSSETSDVESDDSEREESNDDESLLLDNESKLVSLKLENEVEPKNDNDVKVEHSNVIEELVELESQKEIETKIVESELTSPLNMTVGQLVELSKHHLQDLCKSRNLSVKGSKKELIDRLLNK